LILKKYILCNIGNRVSINLTLQLKIKITKAQFILQIYHIPWPSPPSHFGNLLSNISYWDAVWG
jgi:hypothetical protein